MGKIVEVDEDVLKAAIIEIMSDRLYGTDMEWLWDKGGCDEFCAQNIIEKIHEHSTTFGIVAKKKAS